MIFGCGKSAVYVATRTDLSESMGSCAADSASTAMPRKLALLRLVLNL